MSKTKGDTKSEFVDIKKTIIGAMIFVVLFSLIELLKITTEYYLFYDEIGDSPSTHSLYKKFFIFIALLVLGIAVYFILGYIRK
jgi:hypothetical protein